MTAWSELAVPEPGRIHFPPLEAARTKNRPGTICVFNNTPSPERQPGEASPWLMDCGFGGDKERTAAPMQAGLGRAGLASQGNGMHTCTCIHVYPHTIHIPCSHTPHSITYNICHHMHTCTQNPITYKHAYIHTLHNTHEITHHTKYSFILYTDTLCTKNTTHIDT